MVASVDSTDSSAASGHRPYPRRVLIIGGGPCGLVSLRNCVERGDFERVELVERRDNTGGVWYLKEDRKTLSDEASLNKPQWTTPAYPGMIGNVLPEFLSFSGLPFPAFDRSVDEASSEEQPFPTLSETYAYLQDLAEPYVKEGRIRLNSEVLRVEELPLGHGWKVTIRKWQNDLAVDHEETWDAVIMAIGWFDNLVFPPTQGIEELRQHVPRLAIHGKDWKGPKGFEGKRILVVGNAASSNDIAAQLASVTPLPEDEQDITTGPRVFRSIRRPAFAGFPSLPDVCIVNVAPVEKYTVIHSDNIGTPKVKATLRDGTEITNLDLVIFGTGYRPHASIVHVYSPPFSSSSLSPLTPNSHPSHIPLASTVHTGIPALHLQILYAHNPTIGFIGAPMSFTPFTIADVASTWLALAWSQHHDAQPDEGGAIPYPDSVEGRLAFEEDRLRNLNKIVETMKHDSEVEAAKAGDPGKAVEPTSFLSYPVLSVGEEPYARLLREQIVAARPRRLSLVKHLDSVICRWSDEEFARRDAMYARKLQALEAAKARRENPNPNTGG
ncbi:hypothetical protein HGRIS_009502 [Hohenbuehelia grisea]|uniref:FAD/NAD(P)-binding domain-containing protein n=1 Tax=Hohenbuehelia grisea TaxID=104357 RepID=A0ABR3J1D6_9AGAR